MPLEEWNRLPLSVFLRLSNAGMPIVAATELFLRSYLSLRNDTIRVVLYSNRNALACTGVIHTTGESQHQKVKDILRDFLSRRGVSGLVPVSAADEREVFDSEYWEGATFSFKTVSTKNIHIVSTFAVLKAAEEGATVFDTGDELHMLDATVSHKRLRVVKDERTTLEAANKVRKLSRKFLECVEVSFRRLNNHFDRRPHTFGLNLADGRRFPRTGSGREPVAWSLRPVRGCPAAACWSHVNVKISNIPLGRQSARPSRELGNGRISFLYSPCVTLFFGCDVDRESREDSGYVLLEVRIRLDMIQSHLDALGIDSSEHEGDG
jgi:hypothetical protein